MDYLLRVSFRLGIALGLLLSTSAAGFSLLGPYEPWMTFTNGYRQPRDVGGPMPIGCEYRWTLPVITYGVEPSFVRYFGSNGVQAVNAAVRILNSLPPASRIQLTNFPLTTTLVNFEGEALGLVDLKTYILKEVLHQLGLAESIRNVWVIRDRTNHFLGPYHVIQRNYDPETLQPTDTVNEVPFWYFAGHFHYHLIGVSDAVEKGILGFLPIQFTATDPQWTPGHFNSGLSRDDAGGWRYLYSRFNVNREILPPGVTSWPPLNQPALRPGVEKIRFEKMTWNQSRKRFNPVRQRFTLAFYRGGDLKRYKAQRLVTRPDILFRAQPLPPTNIGPATNVLLYPAFAESSTAAHWKNMSPRGVQPGPGVILPGAVITLDSSPPLPYHPWYTVLRWGSFGVTASPPILYPPYMAPESD